MKADSFRSIEVLLFWLSKKTHLHRLCDTSCSKQARQPHLTTTVQGDINPILHHASAFTADAAVGSSSNSNPRPCRACQGSGISRILILLVDQVKTFHRRYSLWRDNDRLWACGVLVSVLQPMALCQAVGIKAGVSKQTWCLTPTETIRLIRDGEMGGYGCGWGWGERGYRYIVTTRKTPALRRAAMRAILMFH